jgi:ATP-binding cassette subfamily F protein 3
MHNVKKLSDEIAQFEKKLTTIETQLTDAELYEEKNKARLQDLLAQQGLIQKKLKSIEEAWLTACEKLELHDKE